jgi:hypothetical protein
VFKKNISDGVGSRNESIDLIPLYTPLFFGWTISLMTTFIMLSFYILTLWINALLLCRTHPPITPLLGCHLAPWDWKTHLPRTVKGGAMIITKKSFVFKLDVRRFNRMSSKFHTFVSVFPPVLLHCTKKHTDVFGFAFIFDVFKNLIFKFMACYIPHLYEYVHCNTLFIISKSANKLHHSFAFFSVGYDPNTLLVHTLLSVK